MYFPIMKNRSEELRVIDNMNRFFSDSIIPLIEIIRDEYKIEYQKDDNTGEFIYEQQSGKKKRNRIKLPSTEEDIITLDKIEKRLNGKKAFIDFFRFTEEEYDNKSFKGIELSVRLSRDFNYYRNRILQIGDYSNLTPVISIKKGFIISEHDLLNLIKNLKEKNSSIAIRIMDTYLDDYIDFLENNLTENDFVMLDIRNQNVDSKFIELDEFRNMNTRAFKILINSPRSIEYKNGDYENLEFTKKISNKVATLYKDYEFDGFGDFGGLKDDLPKNSQGNGTGAALGLLYLKEENAFYSIVNYDTSEGMKGFKNVRDEVLKRLTFLDSNNDCVAINKIKKMNAKYGNWGTWSNITLTRYIQQQTK